MTSLRNLAMFLSLSLGACDSSDDNQSAENPSLPDAAISFEGKYVLLSRTLTQENCESEGVDATEINDEKNFRLSLGSTRQKSNAAIANSPSVVSNTLYTELCDESGDCDSSPKLKPWIFETFENDNWIGRGSDYKAVKANVSGSTTCNYGSVELLLSSATDTIKIEARTIGTNQAVASDATCDNSEEHYESLRSSFACIQIETLNMKRQ
jgi:hypothetical protein